MRRFVALVLAASLAIAPSLADAKGSRRPKVVWSSIVVREGADRASREAALKVILQKEGRRASWGKRKEPVEASIEIRELTTVVEGDVARVTCAAVGKIPGLGAAKSKFSYGGKPSDRAKLERHVLELVARGIVTRLAEMARSRDAGWTVEKS